MKKLLSILLCTVMVFALLPLHASAEEKNIAPLGVAYSSADYNEWAAKRFINNGNYDDSWQAQHISRDPKVGAVGEYCGVRYINDFHQISEIRVCIGTHSGHEVTYGINVLVEGEWIEVAELAEHDATTVDGRAWLIVTLSEPVTTNNVRVVGKEYVGWDLPLVKEIEIYGAKAAAPELVVPEGGEITMNAALAGLAYASSAAEGHYPAHINDALTSGLWMAAEEDTAPCVGVRLQGSRTVNRITVFTGEDNGTPYTSTFDVEALINGKWAVIASGETNAENGYTLDLTLNRKIITEYLRVRFQSEARLCELEVYSAEKNVFVPGKLTEAYKAQAASGNIAVFGMPYAETTFELYSSIDLINDASTDGMWVAEGGNVPVYCGVTLPVAYDVNKVVIYFEDEGDAPHVMKFDVQVLVAGQYLTVATGYSYNPTTGYVAVLDFETVATTDVRIVFTKNGDIFPTLNELQIYAGPDYTDNPYEGYVTELPYGGLAKPENYDAEASKMEAPLTYETAND